MTTTQVIRVIVLIVSVAAMSLIYAPVALRAVCIALIVCGYLSGSE